VTVSLFPAAGIGVPHRTPGRSEWLLLGLLCLGTALYWSVQYRPFLVPNNDYYSFERVAKAFGSGELPRSVKRGPILPLLMAGLAPAMPEPHPELHAALVLNMAFSLGTLLLLFRLAARLFGAGALLVPVLFATTAQFHAMGLQPLVEPSLGFFCVATIVLFQARSPWRTRPRRSPRASRRNADSITSAQLAIRPLLAERGLAPSPRSASSLDRRRHGAWIRRKLYLGLMKMGWAGARALASCYREPFAGWFVGGGALALPFLVLAAAPTLVGIAVGLREFRREAIAMLAFLGLSAAVIVCFGINKPRYVYPTEWILLFFFAAGALQLLETGFRRLAPRLASRAEVPLLLGSAALFLAALGLWVRHMGGLPRVGPFAGDLLYLALALGLALTPLWRIRRGRLWWAACCLFMALVTPVVAGGIASKQLGLFRVYYANYSSYLLAPWLEANLGPRDRVVLLHPTHIRHMTGLAPGRFEKFQNLRAGDAAELAEEMREEKATHVAYTYRNRATTPISGLVPERRCASPSFGRWGGRRLRASRHPAASEILDQDPVQVPRCSVSEQSVPSSSTSTARSTTRASPPLLALELAALPLRGSPASARRTWGVLRVFRRVREELRGLGAAEAPLERLQFERVAERLRMEVDEVEAAVSEWIFRRPLKYLRHFRRAGIDDLLGHLGSRGIPAGVFSDYPAREKLEALRVAERISLVACATDGEINAFKPHPRVRLGHQRWGLEPAEVLYVGDRAEVDAPGAARAGMPCVILARRLGLAPHVEPPARFTRHTSLAGLQHAIDARG
jgi:phosphoglycolate phosphatase/putative hydrolase of the HAD superfamily